MLPCFPAAFCHEVCKRQIDQGAVLRSAVLHELVAPTVVWSVWASAVGVFNERPAATSRFRHSYVGKVSLVVTGVQVDRAIQ